MAADPRKNLVNRCNRLDQGLMNANSRNREAIDALGNLGGIEGTGVIGEGLRALASVSEIVRTGSSVVPGKENTPLVTSTVARIANTALDKVDAGANIVMDVVGLGNAKNLVNSVNPRAVNKGMFEAKNIFQRVKGGNFSISDIPTSTAELLNLENILRKVINKPVVSQQQKIKCDASPYAMDLIARAPKFKFLFVVQIDFHPAYQALSQVGKGLSFVVKTSTRPDFEVEHEDLNLYNFRTLIPKRVTYQPMNMHFYDDNMNNANFFYTAYMRAISPIANMKFNQQTQQSGVYEQSGLDFSSRSSTDFGGGAFSTPNHSASLAALNGNAKSIIQRIRLFHVFDYGKQVTTYNFYNPRITNFELDDLSMSETGDGSDMGFTFSYDGVYIEPNYDLTKDSNLLKSITSGGSYGIDPVYNPEQQISTSTAPSSQQQDIDRRSNPISNAFNKASNFVGSIFG